jgi:hypothetical protein
MEDSASIRKTAEEEKEDEEVARAVNRTLAEEEKKKTEEEKKKTTDGKKKTTDEKKKTEVATKDKEKAVESKDEACPPANFTCPIVQPCPPCEDCRVCQDCPPEKECPEIRCGPCPTVKPCPVVNSTVDQPPICKDPEIQVPAMTVPVAMAVGAAATLLAAGVAAVLGLLLRYVPPLVSGFLFLFLVALTWYLSSHYPETAREWGGRAWTALQEATVALGHRVVEAIQRHNEQVGFPK